MKARFRKKLTQEIILKDYERWRNSYLKSINWQVVVITIAVEAIMLSIFVESNYMAGLIGFLGFILVIVTVGILSNRKKPEEVQFEIREDTVLKVERDSENDDLYHVHFSDFSHPMSKYEIENPYFKRLNVQVGDSCYVVHDSKRPVLAYSMKEWRLDDLTSEEITQEICVEEELAARMIDCEKYPKLTYRKKHGIEDSKRSCQKVMQKSIEEQNFLERFAAKYFLGDMHAALEFMVRYCPPKLQNEVEEDLSVEKWHMLLLVVKHVRKETYGY